VAPDGEEDEEGDGGEGENCYGHGSKFPLIHFLP
jgi:hypothetical protein